MYIQPFLLLILYMAIFNIKKCYHVKVIQCTRGCFGYWPTSHDFQNYLRKSNGMHPAMTKWQNHSVCNAFLDFFNSISKGLHLSRKLSWPKVNLRKPARLSPGLSQISPPGNETRDHQQTSQPSQRLCLTDFSSRTGSGPKPAAVLSCPSSTDENLSMTTCFH